MDRDEAQRASIQLALAQAKKVNRESRILVQMLARIRDNESPTAQEAQGNDDNRSNSN